jgi:hypothetical protein
MVPDTTYAQDDYIEYRERQLLLDPTEANAQLLQSLYAGRELIAERVESDPSRLSKDQRALFEGAVPPSEIPVVAPPENIQVPASDDYPEPPILKANDVVRIELSDSTGLVYVGNYRTPGVELHLTDRETTVKIFAGEPVD